MDDVVIRSMLKWPNVPAVFGWLALDRRGNWLIRTGDNGDIADPVTSFERISNQAVTGFIDRNYARDDDDRYYFQNGPQRVYVALDYTPFVYRLDDGGKSFVAHTGASSGRLKRVFFDEEGSLIISAELGVGVVLDRDLAAILDHFSDRAGETLDPELLFHRVRAGERLAARLMGIEVAISSVRAKEVPGRFRFVARPEPLPGRNVD